MSSRKKKGSWDKQVDIYMIIEWNIFNRASSVLRLYPTHMNDHSELDSLNLIMLAANTVCTGCKNPFPLLYIPPKYSALVQTLYFRRDLSMWKAIWYEDHLSVQVIHEEGNYTYKSCHAPKEATSVQNLWNILRYMENLLHFSNVET